MRNFVGMFLLYICTVLALRPERLGLQNLSQAMMVMGISEPQEEQKSVKMLGEPLEWSHWKTCKNWTVWTFLVVPPYQPCEKSGGDIYGFMLSYWVDMLATDSQSCLAPSRLQKDVLLYPSETDTDRENQWLICPQENALQMDSDDGFFQILVPVRVGSIHLPKQLLGQGCQPRTSFVIWTEVGGWYATKNGVGTCWNPHWVSCWTLCSPRNNLEDLQESDAKAPPVPRCMLADDKKKERKKKNSFIMKKCRDAFQNEEKCLEQAVHGNCKWCEGLCGPSEVWGALTWHSSEHVPHGSGLQCVETKNTPNWFTQKWVNMMKYDEICISILLYIYQIYTTMAICIHGLLMLTGCHFPGPATHNLAEPFGHVRRAQKKREEGGSMVPWSEISWRLLGW